MADPTLANHLADIADAINEARVIGHLVLNSGGTVDAEVDVHPWLGSQLLELVSRMEAATQAARAMVMPAGTA